jgi:hypothetical protein
LARDMLAALRSVVRRIRPSGKWLDGMWRLAVVTTAGVDQIGTAAVDSLFTPLFLTSGEDMVDGSGKSHSLLSLLGSPCVALVGWTDEDSARLEAVQRRLIEAKAAIVPDIVILADQPSWDSLILGVAHCVERFMLLQAKLIGQQTRDLLALRRAHDALQESFSSLERYLTERAVPMLDEAFVCEPAVPLPLADLKRNARAKAFRQYLPVSTKTLGAVSLHVAEADPAAAGEFVAEIVTPEQGTTLATWRLPVSFLQRGWVTLGLDRTSGGLPKSAHLVLRVEGDPGRAKLSLGAVHPLPLYQFSTAGGDPVAARPLALRAFVALPGIQLTHDDATFLPDHLISGVRPRPSVLSRIAIPTASLQQPRLLLPPGGGELDFELVRLIESENAVLVHPARSQPTIALYERCLPPGTRSVSADILVDNPAGGTVGFRLGAVGEPFADRLHMDTLGPAPGHAPVMLSDWSFTGPGRRQSLALTLDVPVGPEGAALLLATRIPDGGSSDFAWAKFASLRLETV